MKKFSARSCRRKSQSGRFGCSFNETGGQPEGLAGLKQKRRGI
jgi:hypothetical protein